VENAIAPATAMGLINPEKPAMPENPEKGMRDILCRLEGG
jgi:hypothetical protein